MSKLIKTVLALSLLVGGVLLLSGCSIFYPGRLASIEQIEQDIYPDDSRQGLDDSNMKLITEVNKEIFPDDFDLGLAKLKGIGAASDYREVQDNYFVLLSTYLCSLYGFSSADAILDGEGFKPIEEGDYYYNRSLLGSKYFYLRNNIHVERLSVAQIIYLKNDTLATDDPEGIQIVKDTCEKVLAVHFLGTEEDEYITSYSTGSGDLGIPNKAIVFYVDYQDLYRGSTNTQKYLESCKRDAKTIDDLSREIRAALQPEFNVEVLIKNQQWITGL